MKLKISVAINSNPESIWEKITDIENATNHISGINKIEILNKPEEGLLGLKWKETRTLFGKTATETMWITEAEKYKYYKTRAESHGSVYTTVISITPENNQVVLSMEFGAKAQSFGAKIMYFLMGWVMKGATKKALMQDLLDIKRSVEQGQPS